MDFALSEEHEMIRQMAREFAEEVLAPAAAQLEQTREFPKENLKKMAELGLLTPPIPEEYGGPGLDTISYAIIGEEVARACGSTATIMGAHCSLCSMPILMFGTEEQKKHYLPQLCSAEKIGAFGLTEPSAGSDAAGIRTRAVKDGSDYVLNGHKQWITNGHYADVFIIMATTNPEAGLRGITPFLLERGAPGFTTGKIEETMGIRGTVQTELHFENVRIPETDILGGPKSVGRGFLMAMKTLDSGRIGVGAASVGIAQAALEAAVKYSKEREQFGSKLKDFQAIQWMIADMATELQAARLMVYYAAWAKDAHHGKCTLEAAQAKLYASEVCGKVTDLALQIHGGYGYTKDFPLERYYRDARIKRIYEGTNEIQRMVIAHEVLRKM
ncbi:MAG: acyl-CoA dehydrogenase [bacterium]|jgi:butyryl-CoA dehydrogenase